MMDIIALAVGFGIGVVVVAIAIEFGTKSIFLGSFSNFRPGRNDSPSL